MRSSLWAQTKAWYIHSHAELDERFESGEPWDICVDYVCFNQIGFIKKCLQVWIVLIKRLRVLLTISLACNWFYSMYINFKGFLCECMQLIVIKWFHDALFSNFSFCLTTHQISLLLWCWESEQFQTFFFFFIKYKQRTRASRCCLNWGTMLLLVFSNQVSSDHNNIAMLKNTRKRLSACANEH